MRRFPLFWIAALATTLAACGSPRPLSLEDRPADRVSVPTSSVHYRAFASSDALAAYLRWTPDAPILVSAHRGGPVPGLVENSLEAFENTLNVTAALIEMDLQSTKDSVLVLLHDETLDRTTTGTGTVSARTLAEVRTLRLVTEDTLVTSFRIPTFSETLAWADHRAILLLDVKPEIGFERVIAAVRRAGAEDRVVVIVYSLADLLAVQRMAPDLNVSATVTTEEDLDELVASGADLSRVIVFGGVGVPDAGVVERLHAMGLRVQAGTFRVDASATPETYTPFLDAGADVLSTDNVRAATVAAQRETIRQRQNR
ncbi:MAG: glycerophosphodiester phosphodiesterase family protein [Rubricoccaceae bacterium]